MKNLRWETMGIVSPYGQSSADLVCPSVMVIWHESEELYSNPLAVGHWASFEIEYFDLDIMFEEAEDEVS